MRRAIGYVAWKVESLSWHRSPKKRPDWFWAIYFRVWAYAERLRCWGYKVGRQ